MAEEGRSDPVERVEDDLEIELDPKPPRRRSSVPSVVVAILVIVALAAAAIYTQWRRQQEELEQARQQRQAEYGIELNAAGRDVADAQALISQERIGESIAKLEDAARRLGTLAGRAATERDDEYAAEVMSRKQAVDAAATSISAKLEELRTVAAAEIGKAMSLLPGASPSLASPGSAPPSAAPSAAPSEAIAPPAQEPAAAGETVAPGYAPPSPAAPEPTPATQPVPEPMPPPGQ